MKFVGAALAILLLTSLGLPAEARRGGFVSSLIRGGTQAAVRSGPGTGTTSSAPKTYGPDVLTVEQLERCLKSAGELDGSADVVDARIQEVETAKSAINVAEKEITEQQEKVNRRSREAVDRFNRKLDALNARITNHNADVRAYKALEASHNEKVASYNAQCAKKYYADDMNTLKQKLGLKD